MKKSFLVTSFLLLLSSASLVQAEQVPDDLTIDFLCPGTTFTLKKDFVIPIPPIRSDEGATGEIRNIDSSSLLTKVFSKSGQPLGTAIISSTLFAVADYEHVQQLKAGRVLKLGGYILKSSDSLWLAFDDPVVDSIFLGRYPQTINEDIGGERLPTIGEIKELLKDTFIIQARTPKDGLQAKHSSENRQERLPASQKH